MQLLVHNFFLNIFKWADFEIRNFTSKDVVTSPWSLFFVLLTLIRHIFCTSYLYSIVKTDLGSENEFIIQTSLEVDKELLEHRKFPSEALFFIFEFAVEFFFANVKIELTDNSESVYA